MINYQILVDTVLIGILFICISNIIYGIKNFFKNR
jgi:hypothetical protein